MHDLHSCVCVMMMCVDLRGNHGIVRLTVGLVETRGMNLGSGSC